MVVVDVLDRSPHLSHVVRVRCHSLADVVLIDLLLSFKLFVIFHLIFLLLDSNKVIDALSLAGKASGNQIFDIDDTFTKLIWVVFNISVDFISLENELHLLLSESFVSELLEQLAQHAKWNTVLGFDEISSE